MSNPSYFARPSPADLNGYVDGELDPDAAARVAAAVAADSGLAQEVARLTQLKWALGSHHEAAPADLLPDPPRRTWRPLLAASVALLILAGGAWTTYEHFHSSTMATPEVLLQAARLHAHWIGEQPDPERPEAARLLAAVHGFGHPLLLPDLSDNRLQMVSVNLSGEAQEILHIGYRGTRGCQVSLLAFRDSRLPPELQQVSQGQNAAYLWRVGQIGYVLLADGMSEERMTVIAQAAEESTRSGSRISPETRTALADSRARSEPCLG